MRDHPCNQKVSLLKDATRELCMQGACLPQLLMRFLCKVLSNQHLLVQLGRRMSCSGATRLA